MALNINTGNFQESLKELFPEPFPEIWEKWQNPTGHLVKGIEEEIRTTFDDFGLEGIYDLRESNSENIKVLKNRLDDLMPHDDEFKIYCALKYFEIFNNKIAEIIPTLKNRNKKLATKKPDYKQAKDQFIEIIGSINKGIENGDIGSDNDVVKVFRRFKSDFEMKEGDKKYFQPYAKYDDKNKTGISKALKRIFDYKFSPQVGRSEPIKTYCNRNNLWDA